MFRPVAAPENTEFVAIPHEFLKPYQGYVRQPDGGTVFTGYGIGEIVKVMEPRLQLLVCSGEHMTKIKLADGTELLDVPVDIHLKRVWRHDVC